MRKELGIVACGLLVMLLSGGIFINNLEGGMKDPRAIQAALVFVTVMVGIIFLSFTFYLLKKPKNNTRKLYK